LYNLNVSEISIKEEENIDDDCCAKKIKGPG
jgi:hypothetical protein